MGFGRALEDPTTESAARRKRSIVDNFERVQIVRKKRNPQPVILTNRLASSLSHSNERRKRQSGGDSVDSQPGEISFFAQAKKMFNKLDNLCKTVFERIKSMVGGSKSADSA